MNLNTALKIETTSEMEAKLSEFHNHCLTTGGRKTKKGQTHKRESGDGMNWVPGSRIRKKQNMHISTLSVTHFIIPCQSFTRSLSSLLYSLFVSFWFSQTFALLPSHLCQVVTVCAAALTPCCAVRMNYTSANTQRHTVYVHMCVTGKQKIWFANVVVEIILIFIQSLLIHCCGMSKKMTWLFITDWVWWGKPHPFSRYCVTQWLCVFVCLMT